MKHTATEDLKVVQAQMPDTLSAGAEAFTSGVDCQGFDEALVILNCGDFTATGDVSFQLEESSDDAVADAYADITGAAISEKTTSTDATVYVGRIDLAKRERYIRVGIDVDDDTVDIAITFVLLNAKTKPVSQTNTVSFSV